MQKFKSFWKNYIILLRSVPSLVTSLFVLSVVCMNLMAGRELYRSELFCINSGLAISWISFLCMDCVCKRFGGKAATMISMTAMTINILTTIVFKLLCMTPGKWAAYYMSDDAATAELLSAAVDSTFGNAWYVVVGSSVAMLLSTLVNSSLNTFFGHFDKGNYQGFATRSFISTLAAQWVDNFVFSAIVSHVFFGWTWVQVLICSTTSMFIELAFEMIFSPFGYRISKNWEKDNVGKLYLDTLKEAA